jgi:ureidoacrylate peracid hydrolase
MGLSSPEAGGLDVTGAAVVVVDMQNDFCSPSGMVGRRGVDITSIQALVEPIRRILSAARGAGVAVVYLKMGYHPDLSDTGGPDAPNWFKVHSPAGVGETIVLEDGTTSRILIRDTWNTEIIDELAPEPGDVVMLQAPLQRVLRD